MAFYGSLKIIGESRCGPIGWRLRRALRSMIVHYITICHQEQ
jgi:hypothetical protein